MTKTEDERAQTGEKATLQPITFHVPEPGDTAVAIVFLVGLGALSVFNGYLAALPDGDERVISLAFSLVAAFVAVVVPIWARQRSRRKGEVVIDPIRGEIRIARSYGIPFSSVRKVDVVEHEYTHRAINASHELDAIDMKGWTIDIGGGRYLCGQNGLSWERVNEIADALLAEVRELAHSVNGAVL